MWSKFRTLFGGSSVMEQSLEGWLAERELKPCTHQVVFTFTETKTSSLTRNGELTDPELISESQSTTITDANGHEETIIFNSMVDTIHINSSWNAIPLGARYFLVGPRHGPDHYTLYSH